MKFLIFVLMMVGLCACDAVDFTIPHHDMPGRMVIFPAVYAETQQSHYIVGEPVDAYWSPSIGNAMTMERVAMAQLREDDRMQSKVDMLPHGYWRQITGVTIDGEDYVFAVYSCMAFEDWREQWIGIDDGGNCFFEVLYHPATDEITRLYIHGDA
ncbi:MAG: hypothetical protein ACPG7F_09070 [Aggregatilineales bacterium]